MHVLCPADEPVYRTIKLGGAGDAGVTPPFSKTLLVYTLLLYEYFIHMYIKWFTGHLTGCMWVKNSPIFQSRQQLIIQWVYQMHFERCFVHAYHV